MKRTERLMIEHSNEAKTHENTIIDNCKPFNLKRLQRSIENVIHLDLINKQIQLNNFLKILD